MGALALAVLLVLGLVACGAEPAYVIRDVPPPGVSMPFGLLAVDVELGDTRGARLRLSALGYIDREIPLPSDGTYVVRLQPAEWKVQVVGVPGKADVITFGGQPSSDAAGGSSELPWPKDAIVMPVVRNHLSNTGHLCAHRTCKDTWQPFDHPQFAEWQRSRRYEEAIPTVPELEVPKDP